MAFTKKKEFLVCVDSDGCAIDTMKIKHMRCFGPCLVQEWELQEWEQEILERWNRINLYSMTRGVNRFTGLALALREIHEQYIPIEGLDTLAAWVRESDELSESSLARAIDRRPSICLEKALHWSRSVNEAIRQLPTAFAFETVEGALRYAHNHADIAIVSGANRAAVVEEWEQNRLMAYVDDIMTQDCGSKRACIAKLLERGYAPEQVLMCGDAPGDARAAKESGISFYPILADREEESWREFIDVGLGRFLSGQYPAYEEKKRQQFYHNLGAEGE